jgi:hypothetical protein
MSPVDPENSSLDLSRFTVTKRDVRVVSFCCDIVLYTNKDLCSEPDAVLYIYEKFLAACPPGVPRWFATENMTRHKPCTVRALNMLRGWLKPDAPPRKIVNIHLTDGLQLDDASEYSFWVYGEERGEMTYGQYANVIRCAFPGRWGLEDSDRYLAFVADACEHFPFQSGHGGLVLELSRYARSASHTAAWQLSMQHPGLDISNPITDAIAVGRDAIKGVNWLTILGSEFADRVGGSASLRSELPNSVRVILVNGGVILQAGPAPRWGHVNRRDLLPDYRAVYRIVSPLQEAIFDRYTAFSLPGGDHREKTKAWLRRFADAS